MPLTRENLLQLIERHQAERKTSVSALEREAGLAKDTLRDFLRGKTHLLRADKMEKLRAVIAPQNRLSVAGVVEAEGRIRLSDAPGALGVAPCPPGLEAEQVIVLRVETEAMQPVLYPGALVYYSTDANADAPLLQGGWQVPYAKTEGAKTEGAKTEGAKTEGATTEGADASGGLEAFLGKPAILTLGDGKRMLRTLKAGKQEKRYDLIAYNAETLENVEVTSAARILFIMPA
jgi:hypothetical protein